MTSKYSWVNDTLVQQIKKECEIQDLKSSECYYYDEEDIINSFRNEEVELIALGGPISDGIAGAIVYFDRTREVSMDALCGIFRTIFVMIILVWGASAFNKDAQKLVIGPIERMVKVVKGIQTNPMASVVLADDGEFEEESYETVMLQHTIEKIGGLLQVGFGEAGAEIIAKNMNTEDGNLNAMVPGQRMTAVFGFCDIATLRTPLNVFSRKLWFTSTGLARSSTELLTTTLALPTRTLATPSCSFGRSKRAGKSITGATCATMR